MAEGREYFTKRDVIESLGMISVNQAGYLIKKLIDEGKIQILNRGRYSKYRLIRDKDKLEMEDTYDNTGIKI